MKLGAVFSGQGSQYADMGKQLFSESEVARSVYKEAENILSYDLLKVYENEEDSKLRDTRYSQPAIFTYSVAAFKTFINEYGWLPHVFAGHSVGEYAALVCAEAISFEDALKIVVKRSELMNQSKRRGGMIAVIGLDKEKIYEYCQMISQKEGSLSISNYNTNIQSIVAGETHLVNAAVPVFEEMGATVKPLAVNIASHCEMMDDIIDDFRKELKKYRFGIPHRPVISNVDGQPYKENEDIQEKLTEQLIRPVGWVDIMRKFNRERITHVIEFGPKRALRNFFRTDYPDISSYSIDTEEDVEDIKHLMSSQSYKDAINTDFIDRCMAAIACTPNYKNNNQDYMEKVVLPSRNIIQIRKTFHEKTYDSRLICEEVLELLLKVLTEKGVPEEEQKIRLRKLFGETGQAIHARCVYKRLNMFQ